MFMCQSENQRAGYGAGWMRMECDMANRSVLCHTNTTTVTSRRPFLSGLQTETCSSTYSEIHSEKYSTNCREIWHWREKRGVRRLWRFLTQNSAAVDCAVTLKGNFIWLTETCMRAREGSVCFFSTRGSVTWSVREFSIQIFLCNWRTVSTGPRVCAFTGASLELFTCVCARVLMCFQTGDMPKWIEALLVLKMPSWMWQDMCRHKSMQMRCECTWTSECTYYRKLGGAPPSFTGFIVLLACMCVYMCVCLSGKNKFQTSAG